LFYPRGGAGKLSNSEFTIADLQANIAQSNLKNRAGDPTAALKLWEAKNIFPNV
jgi:hypothetical protein